LPNRHSQQAGDADDDCRDLDNPISAAYGFRLKIGKACFLFTLGIPRELHGAPDGDRPLALRARRLVDS
jgi:hypothetical protein